MAIEITESNADQSKVTSNASTRLHKFKSHKVSTADRMLFTERLAMLVETGNPLFTSLDILKNQIENRELQAAITAICEDINSGKSFANALNNHQDIFDKTYINLVAAGEQGGFLSEVLEQLCKMDKQRHEMSSMVKQAMMYPLFLLVFSIGIVIFILAFVFPKFAEMFSSMTESLPVTTVWLMAVSDLLVNNWRSILLGFAAFILIASRIIAKPAVSKIIDEYKLSLPLIKEIVIQYYLIQTLRVLSMSLRNGVNILDALNGCLDVVKNQTFRQFLIDASVLVESGDGLAKGFDRSPVIPVMVKQMIHTGEQSAQLPFVMLRISQYYEVELEKRIRMVSKLAEPIMLMIMGVFVGVLVGSLILPIFKLSSSVH